MVVDEPWFLGDEKVTCQTFSACSLVKPSINAPSSVTMSNTTLWLGEASTRMSIVQAISQLFDTFWFYHV